MTAVVPPAQRMPPSTLAIRNFQYGMRSTPASGPAKIRSSATKRPKKTAHMPHFSKDRSAVAMCASPKCLGNFAAEPGQQRAPALAADGVADGVADDRAGRGAGAEDERVDVAVLRGEQRRDDQDDLAGQRDAQALQPDDQAHQR